MHDLGQDQLEFCYVPRWKRVARVAYIIVFFLVWLDGVAAFLYFGLVFRGRIACAYGNTDGATQKSRSGRVHCASPERSGPFPAHK
jgi:hypothetical protein